MPQTFDASLALTPLASLRLSAGSALVYHQQRLWLLADDALVLQQYSPQGLWLGELPLLPGRLPADPAQRKRLKPDFEALLLLPDGSLLALGSGSTPLRRRGCRLRDGRVEPIDLSPLYLALETQFRELNLEGAVVYGEQLLLAQRGNGAAGEHALICLDLLRAMADLQRGCLTAAGLQRVLALAPGTLEQVPLGLTDLCLDPAGRLYFSAAAEASGSTYADGECVGSVLGRFGPDLQVEWRARLETREKIEGLCFLPDGRLLLVADPDDPQRCSPLFALDGL